MSLLFPLIVLFFSVIIGMLLVHEGFVGISAEDLAAQEAAFEALKATYDQGSRGSPTTFIPAKTFIPATTSTSPSPNLTPDSVSDSVSGSVSGPVTSQTGNLGLNNPEAVAYASGLQQSLYSDSARSEMPTTRALSQGSSYLANIQTKGNSPPVPTTVPIVYGCPKSSCDDKCEDGNNPVAVQVGGYPFSTADKDTCEKCCD